MLNIRLLDIVELLLTRLIGLEASLIEEILELL